MSQNKQKGGFVYIVSNWTGKVIYIGVTSNLERRLYEHKNEMIKGFSQKYKTNKLVYFEQFDDITYAIEREKEIKKWRREKKDRLINNMNSGWNDLSENWYEDSSHAFGMTGKV